MEFIVFTKHWRGATLEETMAGAQDIGVQGLDLTVRDGYPVNPGNVADAVPKAVDKVKAAGLSVPMVTADGHLVFPDDPAVEPLLAAMDAADVRLLKLGYHRHTPEMSYREELGKLRAAFGDWESLGDKHGVKICYHTHSGPYYGGNASGLMRFLEGRDPKTVGAYLDVAHLAADGEPFGMALDIVGEYLSVVAFKDVTYSQTVEEGRRATSREFGPCGSGLVDFDEVFGELARVGFDGPVSIHCEYKKDTEEEWVSTAKAEVAFVKERYEAGKS